MHLRLRVRIQVLTAEDILLQPVVQRISGDAEFRGC